MAIFLTQIDVYSPTSKIAHVSAILGAAFELRELLEKDN